MNLAADENIPPAIAGRLSEAGIHLVLVAAERPGATDSSNLQWALEQDMALLTFDDDYLRLAAAGHAHAGVIFCHQLKYRVGGLSQALVKLLRSGRWPGPGEIVFL